MPKTLSPIPGGVPITERDNSITVFFRQVWQALIDSFQLTPTVAATSGDGLQAAIATTTLYTTITGARYRVSCYLRKTIADGVSSALTLTIGWTESGVAQTKTFATLMTDTTTAEQDTTMFLRADQATAITIAIAYASNTPGKMAYNYDAVAEQLA